MKHLMICAHAAAAILALLVLMWAASAWPDGRGSPPCLQNGWLTVVQNFSGLARHEWLDRLLLAGSFVVATGLGCRAGRRPHPSIPFYLALGWAWSMLAVGGMAVWISSGSASWDAWSSLGVLAATFAGCLILIGVVVRLTDRQRVMVGSSLAMLVLGPILLACGIAAAAWASPPALTPAASGPYAAVIAGAAVALWSLPVSAIVWADAWGEGPKHSF